MSVHVTYHIGGFVAAAPAQNKREQWDSVAQTYTAWDEAGVQTAQRSFTVAEVTEFVERDATLTGYANRAQLLTKAQQALTANQTFLALASPTNPQTLAQVRLLTRQVNALIRLELNDLADVSDT